ncbi:hypothetical protein PP589_gp36 [Pseudoalteromonas phage HS5]|uniref:hypothetical protein n=1 Tax=Pseudoalteromonas phage HS5 TaxID=1357709 RepID=UPI002329069C|nr:hypothetical protein PP589_gp36 [Pseudoalteromonas phage HS5]
MRDYKVTYETPLLGYTKIRESKIVTAESKQEAIKIAVPSSYKFISVRLMPIKKVKKPFDITKHEFSEGLSISNMCKLSVEVKFNNNDDSNYVPLHKDDVIAIAKALGVTGEDLK